MNAKEPQLDKFCTAGDRKISEKSRFICRSGRRHWKRTRNPIKDFPMIIIRNHMNQSFPPGGGSIHARAQTDEHTTHIAHIIHLAHRSQPFVHARPKHAAYVWFLVTWQTPIGLSIYACGSLSLDVCKRALMHSEVDLLGVLSHSREFVEVCTTVNLASSCSGFAFLPTAPLTQTEKRTKNGEWSTAT